MLELVNGWARTYPFRASLVLVVLSLIAATKFIPAFGFRPVESGALCFAAIASLIHCWRAGAFMQKAQG